MNNVKHKGYYEGTYDCQKEVILITTINDNAYAHVRMYRYM